MEKNREPQIEAAFYIFGCTYHCCCKSLGANRRVLGISVLSTEAQVLGKHRILEYLDR